MPFKLLSLQYVKRLLTMTILVISIHLNDPKINGQLSIDNTRMSTYWISPDNTSDIRIISRNVPGAPVLRSVFQA